MSESVGDDSESSNSSSKPSAAQLDNIAAGSGEVWLRLCCGDEERAKRKQGCRMTWRNIGIALLVIAAIGATPGIVYLWLVPYSNALALFMWPDRPCQSLWFMCGTKALTTWAAWTIHVATIDVFVLGIILMCIFASRASFQRNVGRCRYCCPIIPNFGNGKMMYNNVNIFGASVFCLVVAAFVTLVLISLYAGRLAAFETISGCAQFKGTIISFDTGGACSIYAPTSPSSNVSDPVFGWIVLDRIDAQLGAQCTWCQSIGFVIIFFTVVGAVAAIWLAVSIALGCAAACLAWKKKYDQTRNVIVAEKRQRAIEEISEAASVQSMDIE